MIDYTGLGRKCLKSSYFKFEPLTTRTDFVGSLESPAAIFICMVRKIFTYLFSGFIFICALPFIVLYNVLGVFWKLFGLTIISFLILWMYGLGIKESIGLSGSLAFFVGLVFSIRNEYRRNRDC